MATEYPPPGRLVTVNGHQMHLHCGGEGEPTVVLDAGLGGSSLDWSRVQPAVAKETRVCSYDRSGYGWSEPAVGPRTSAAIADELHRLLAAAGVPGPYVLVGHSFGGVNVRLFAARYPGQVAGLVLVDSSQANQVERFAAAGIDIPVAPQGQFMVYSPPSLPPNLPANVHDMVAAFTYRPLTNRTVYTELDALDVSMRQLAQVSGHLPEVPLVVITRGENPEPGSHRRRRMEAVWQALQREFVAAHPGAVHLVARHAGHYVQLEQPGIVVGGICIAVQEAKAGNSARRLPRGWLRQRCLPLRQAAAWVPWLR